MTNNSTCTILAPSSSEFSENVYDQWRAGGVAFLTIPVVLTAVLVAVYVEEVIYVLRKGDSKPLINSFCWLLGTQPAVMLLGTIAIFMPRSLTFLTFMYSVYVSFAIYKYYYLIMIFSGGTFAFVQKTCEKEIGLNQMPCCCLVCLPTIQNTARTTNIAKWFILQNSVSSLVIGGMATILKAEGKLYSLDGISASLILSFLNSIATLLCMYGFKLIDKLSKNIDGMEQTHAIRGKTKCMQLTLFIIGFEGSIFNILDELGLLPCVPPFNFVSKNRAIFNYAVVLQMFFLGLVARCFYRRKSDVQRQAILTDDLDYNSHDPNLNLTTVDVLDQHPSYNGTGTTSLGSSQSGGSEVKEFHDHSSSTST